MPSISSSAMTNCWDVYWTGTRENAAHQEGGPQEPVLAQFWGELFARDVQGSRLLDVAAGNGAVIGYAQQGATGLSAWAVDSSVNAGVQLRERYPAVSCIAADAQRLPFASGQFARVCSQFGIEYAGLGAFAEAARLVAPGGVLASIAHLHSGAIFAECHGNQLAAEAVLGCGVLPTARQAFAAGYALNNGRGDVASFKAAERQFTPKVRALEAVMAEYGQGAAGGLPKQIYRDIAHMYQRLSAHKEAEVLAWIDGMSVELEAYRGRMQSMQDAALTDAELEQVLTAVAAQGLKLIERRTLNMGNEAEPGAWVLVWSQS